MVNIAINLTDDKIIRTQNIKSPQNVTEIIEGFLSSPWLQKYTWDMKSSGGTDEDKRVIFDVMTRDEKKIITLKNHVIEDLNPLHRCSLTLHQNQYDAYQELLRDILKTPYADLQNNRAMFQCVASIAKIRRG